MYVVFEGPDGAGKTTALARVAALLEERFGVEVLKFREPSGRLAGLAAMSYLVENTRDGTSTVDPYVAALLMTAQRVDLAPLLRKGKADKAVVLSDRSFLTTYVYQDKVDTETLDVLHGFDRASFLRRRVPLPDLVVYLSVDPETTLRRARARGREFFSDAEVRRVAVAYQGVISRWNLIHPYHQLKVLTVDTSSLGEDQVSELVVDTISGMLDLRPRPSSPEAA